MTITGEPAFATEKPPGHASIVVPASLRVRLSWLGSVAVVHCAGPLDTAGAPLLEAAATAAFDERAVGLVVDLGGVGELDNVGLRTLLSLQRRARAHGCGTGLAALQPAVVEFLRRLCADRSLPCFDTVADAARELASAVAWR